MTEPMLPEGENERLAELQKYEILDSESEKEYDEIVQLASQICQTPISLITLVDAQRQWFKAKVGMEANETLRKHAFCAYTIHSDEALIVENAIIDERFSENPLVTSNPKIRFYAGFPLTTPGGFRLGTLCVIDTKPRKLTEKQHFALKVLSKQVVQLLELRYKNKKLHSSLQKIQEQNRQLEQNNQVSNKLISIISHDLSSPLTTLKGLIALYREGELTEAEVDNTCKDISSLVDGSLELLHSLLYWGKNRIKVGGADIQTVNIYQLLRDELETAEVIIRTKGNQIYNWIQEGFTIDTDPTLVRFILRNLILNANKFTEQSTIEISADEAHDTFNITVSDKGRGMKESQIKQLFEWNIRNSTLGTIGEKGVGLGLPICQEFAESLGGSILVNSSPGKGSEFTLCLPSLNKDPFLGISTSQPD